jgi:hypothetical protein
MFNNSGPLTEIKLIPASFATALASKVFPQPINDFFFNYLSINLKLKLFKYLPGGPHNKTPDGDCSPKILSLSGNLTGAKMANFNSSRMLRNEPTSSHVTSGTVINPSRLADG